MKPQKNRVYCIASHRLKMLFETQAKADRFIRFNQEEIEEENGKAPVRSYFCSLCGGYHVTSNPSEVVGKRFDELNEIKAETASRLAKLCEKDDPTQWGIYEKIMNEANEDLSKGRLDMAEELLKNALAKYNLGELKGSGRAHKIETLLTSVREAKQIIARVTDILAEVDENTDIEYEEAIEKFRDCRRMLKEMIIPFKNTLIKPFKQSIMEKENSFILIMKLMKDKTKEGTSQPPQT